ALTGSLGMLPSASIADGSFGMYEPGGGSAPDIAGQGIANPIAQILSVAMMLRYSFEMVEAAEAIEKAVEDVLNDGYRTGDIWQADGRKVGTAEMGDRIVEKLSL
ncbi:MAG: isocitrate/isopropylmalate family dehydrogenase, partial [bacterium]